MHYEAGFRPGIKHLTIGQAERILQAYGLDAAPLQLNGRADVGKNRASAVARWFFGLLSFTIVCLIPGIGWLAAAIWLMSFVVILVRLNRRQKYEDNLGRIRLVTDRLPRHS
ncbi:hypothetical protein [Arthrobacter sp. 2MCAF14]|uniref:hypothetical protein n=1 Tax=Arthrobacter sp. 2MCAF14 TaxID=3232982 RepID=UPI003F90DB7A